MEDILEATGIQRSHTLYVGDTNVDMLTAQNSRTTSVGVTWGFRSRQELQEAGAELIVDIPKEIAEWIRQQG